MKLGGIKLWIFGRSRYIASADGLFYRKAGAVHK
jgi:hypothetical protein